MFSTSDFSSLLNLQIYQNDHQTIIITTKRTTSRCHRIRVHVLSGLLYMSGVYVFIFHILVSDDDGIPIVQPIVEQDKKDFFPFLVLIEEKQLPPLKLR